jgi:hypothetical protein
MQLLVHQSCTTLFPTRSTGNAPCKKFHGPNGPPSPASACFETDSTTDAGVGDASPFFISLTTDTERPSPSRSKPTKRRRTKTPWYEKARYQRSRCEKRLKPNQVAGLHDADHHARCIGLPLNVFLSVNWKYTTVGNDDLRDLFRAACKRMDAFCRRKGFSPAWIYVHEAPDGRANTHYLIHVPQKHRSAFIEKLRGWFEAIDPAAIDAQRRHWRRGPDKRLAYMCKGTDIVTASRMGGRAKRQGDIGFKRCGTTVNIGPKARARFHPKPLDAAS